MPGEEIYRTYSKTFLVSMNHLKKYGALKYVHPSLRKPTFHQRPTYSSSVKCSHTQVQTSMEKRVTLTHRHTHTHTHSSSPFYLISDLLGSDLWHLYTSDQTNTHTASHTNKIKHTPNRWRESRFKEVYSERTKRFESRQEVGTWQE